MPADASSPLLELWPEDRLKKIAAVPVYGSFEAFAQGDFRFVAEQVLSGGDVGEGALYVARAMSGVLLFTSHNKFLVVNNSNAKKKNWIKV